MLTILLIRHGENEYTRLGKLAGRLPVPLNETGLTQAEAIAQKLASVPFQTIYASPLLRTMQTATPLATAKSLPIQALPGVQELDFGDWQDQPLAKLRRQKLWQTVQYQPSNVTFPGGESFRAAQTRAVAAIEQIVQSFDLRKKNYVAVFSHSDMIKLLLAFYVGMPLDSFQRLMVSTGSVSTLCFTPMGVVVAGINQIFK